MRHVLLGSIDVYCWEDDKGETHMEAYDLHGVLLHLEGRPVVLVDPAAGEAEVMTVLKEKLGGV